MRVKIPVTLGDMGAKGLELLANEIVALLRRNDAPNFMGMQLTDNHGTDWMLTVQRIGGETPEQQNGRLKAEIAALKEHIARAESHIVCQTEENYLLADCLCLETYECINAIERAEKLEAELAALKAAAGPVVKYYRHRQGRDAKHDYIPELNSLFVGGPDCCVTYGQLDELARLCGEG